MAKIMQEECVGCGVCANICPDGIEMINGKAKIKNEKNI
jgi:Fe-S-cluster-containing hydrogenase component 2